MRRRIALPLGAALVLLITALSTGSPVFLAPAVLLAALMLLGGVSVRWAARTLSVGAETDHAAVERGEAVRLTIRAGHRCPLPLAPLQLLVITGPGTEPVQVSVRQRRDGSGEVLPFTADHVGACRPGARSCRGEDLFGFFSKTVETPEAGVPLTVLPNTFALTPLAFFPADPGLGTMATATEDASEPVDVRAWQRGDPLKKVHWKLSARKRSLVVRHFEEPTQPEALILLDCTRPDPGLNEAATRDALVETAASVMKAQEGGDNDVRLPLWGRHPTELTLRMGLPLVFERLAQVDFSATEGFEKQLMDAARRLRQVGATVVITSRLSGRMVEPLIRMRRLGPSLRIYLVSDTPDRADWQPLIARLQQAEAEVCSVRPVRV